MSLTLEQIFNRTENLNYTKKYNYIEQKGINGKPTIISGDENLKEITLKIKLHHSFCNPKDIIEELEYKAQNREIINWFQHGTYIGDFVIKNVHSNIIQKIDNAVICAEIEVTLLEYNNFIGNFVQQIKNIGRIIHQTFKSDSHIIHNFNSNIEKKIKNNIYKETLLKLNTSNINELSPFGNKILHKIQTQMVEEIEQKGIKKANEILNKYINNINNNTYLNSNEKRIIIEEISKIPKIILNLTLRNSLNH